MQLSCSIADGILTNPRIAIFREGITAPRSGCWSEVYRNDGVWTTSEFVLKLRPKLSEPSVKVDELLQWWSNRSQRFAEWFHRKGGLLVRIKPNRVAELVTKSVSLSLTLRDFHSGSKDLIITSQLSLQGTISIVVHVGDIVDLPTGCGVSTSSLVINGGLHKSTHLLVEVFRSVLHVLQFRSQAVSTFIHNQERFVVMNLLRHGSLYIVLRCDIEGIRKVVHEALGESGILRKIMPNITFDTFPLQNGLGNGLSIRGFSQILDVDPSSCFCVQTKSTLREDWKVHTSHVDRLFP